MSLLLFNAIREGFEESEMLPALVIRTYNLKSFIKFTTIY